MVSEVTLTEARLAGRDGRGTLGIAGTIGIERLALWSGFEGAALCCRGKTGATAEEGVVG